MRRKLLVGIWCVGLLVGTALATVTSASAGVPAAASPLGTPKKATGAVVTIGFVSDGKSDAIDNTPEIKAAQAAVKYANDYLGGLAGHKLALNVCETHQTPSGATDCATNMVQAKVPIVITPVSGQSGTIYHGIKASGIRLPAVRIARPGRARWFARERLRPHERHRHRARRSGGDRHGCGGQEGRDPGDRRARRVGAGQGRRHRSSTRTPTSPPTSSSSRSARPT